MPIPWCLLCKAEMVPLWKDGSEARLEPRTYAYTLWHCPSDSTLCKREEARPQHATWLFANGAVLHMPQSAQADEDFTRRFSFY